MTIQLPPCEWPAGLEERGPPEDPSILLTGTARLAGNEMQVVAIRIDRSRRCAPGYRPEAPDGCYRANGLNVVLEVALEEIDYIAGEFGELLGKDEPSVIEFENGPYLLWMMPATFSA